MFSSLGCALTTSKYHKRAPIWSQESWVFYSSCFVEILLACRIHDIIRFKTSTTWTINRNRQKSLLFFLFSFLFSFAFWSRCAIKNYIFFTRRLLSWLGIPSHFFCFLFLFFFLPSLFFLFFFLFLVFLSPLFRPSVACLLSAFPLV